MSEQDRVLVEDFSAAVRACQRYAWPWQLATAVLTIVSAVLTGVLVCRK